MEIINVVLTKENEVLYQGGDCGGVHCLQYNEGLGEVLNGLFI